MNAKKAVALILSVAILLSILPAGMVAKAEADTSVPEETENVTQPSQENTEPTTEVTEPTETEKMEETIPIETVCTEISPTETISAPETIEATSPSDPSEVTWEPTEPTAEQTWVEITIPERIHGRNFTDPAPLGSPVKGIESSKAPKLKSFQTSAEDDNLVLHKTVHRNEDETFTLTLESYATGTASVVTKVPVPADVVLVLDESGSMDDCIACGHEMSVDCSSFEENCLHKVFSSELDTAKKYKTYYRDKTERIVGYCSACQKWYTGGPFTKCSGHGSLGNWIAFSSASDKHSYENKVYITQFYAVCDHNTRRIDALKGAATNFLNKMYSSALGADGLAGTADDVDNRVAIVGYDNDVPARIYTPRDETSSGYVLADSASNATGVLKNICSERNEVMNGLNKVRVRAATATNRGMEAAELILASNPVPPGAERNRVVVLFTDGSPGSNYYNNMDWANSAISHAHTIKQSLGATVYTIGLFWGADASDPINLPVYDVNANGVNNLKFFQNGNRFLHLVSSNYPNASSLNSTGMVASLKAGEGYYLSAEDEAGLYTIFGKLSNVVTPGSTTVTLDENTVVKDFITPYFDICQGMAIRAWTESYGENDSWTKDVDSVSTPVSGPLSVTVAGNMVSVSNFDFAKHYVAADKNAEDQILYRGKKLVIQIAIQPVAGFLGGDDIVTNTTDSAVYAGEAEKEPVKRFPVPEVDVPVRKIIPQTKERDIYLSQLSSLPELLNPGRYSFGDDSFTVDSIRNGYADIVYTISDPEGKRITCTIPAGSGKEELLWIIPEGMALESLLKEDTTYHISSQVISVNDRTHTAEYLSNAEVKVYIPEITFCDSAINLGQTADYRNNYVMVKWLHAGVPASVTVMGPAPVLNYSYDPAATAFTQDTSVKVNVTAKKNMEMKIPEDQNITPYAMFFRDACHFRGCVHTEKMGVDALDSGRINFVVHINTFDLRIEKTGADLELDPNSSFLFRISGPDGFSMDVVIHGNSYAVIKNLPVAAYTITELTEWSWRYEPRENSINISAEDVKNQTAIVHFSNIRQKDQWLDGESYAENRFSAGESKQEGATEK